MIRETGFFDNSCGKQVSVQKVQTLQLLNLFLLLINVDRMQKRLIETKWNAKSLHILH